MKYRYGNLIILLTIKKTIHHKKTKKQKNKNKNKTKTKKTPPQICKQEQFLDSKEVIRGRK